MKKALVLWKCLVSKKTVNKETLVEEKWGAFVNSRKCSLISYTFSCILNPLDVSISNASPVCILLVLQPLLPVPSDTALSAPHVPWETRSCPSVPLPALPLPHGPDSPRAPSVLLSSISVSHKKLPVHQLARRLLLTKMNSPVFPLTGWNKVSFLYTDVKLG